MLPLSLELFFIVVALIFYAFFSLIETGVLTVRRSTLKKITEDVEESDRIKHKAHSVLKIKARPEEFLAFVQSGSILSVVFAATFAGFFAVEDLSHVLIEWFKFSNTTSIVISLIITALVLAWMLLTFGGLIPKSIGLHRNRRIALFFGDAILAALGIIKPLTHLPVLLANIILKPFRDKASFAESRISEEEFRVMLEEGARTGVLDKTENELIENILDFTEKTVREVMVPRTKIVAIDIESSRESVIHKIISEGYTRLPVYQDTLDNIVGVVYSKDVLGLIEHPDLILLYDITRPVAFVPETKLISELLRELQQKKFHMVIVVDEFGGTAGIVTLEDILEEIVGEIHDEYDEDLPPVQKDVAGKALTLAANLSTKNANEHIESFFEDFRIPENDEYDSVGGYVTKLFGHIPETGEEQETGGMAITVLKRTPREVLLVKFEDHRIDQSEGENP
ncbi:MAG: hemolysin family protein [Bacteroidota bacterium]|nr:hemolysin family protein [Bacteroidota bacterium]